MPSYSLESGKRWQRTVPNGKGKFYELQWNGAVLSCSCPSWRFSKVPNQQRTCIHTRHFYPAYVPAQENPLIKVKPPRVPLFATFDEEKHAPHIEQFWWSVKHDGIRAIWTGEQLITRNGHVINAPRQFELLPPEVQLDGELVADSFENMLLALQGGPEASSWDEVRYMVFDSPQWPDEPFSERYQRLLEMEDDWNFEVIRQHRVRSFPLLQSRLARLTEAGEEGMVLRHPQALYRGGRNVRTGLKYKLVQTGEADIMESVDAHSFLVRVHNPREVRGKTIRLYIAPHEAGEVEVGQRIIFTYRGLTGHGKPRFARYEARAGDS